MDMFLMAHKSYITKLVERPQLYVQGCTLFSTPLSKTLVTNEFLLGWGCLVEEVLVPRTEPIVLSTTTFTSSTRLDISRQKKYFASKPSLPLSLSLAAEWMSFIIGFVLWMSKVF